MRLLLIVALTLFSSYSFSETMFPQAPMTNIPGAMPMTNIPGMGAPAMGVPPMGMGPTVLPAGPMNPYMQPQVRVNRVRVTQVRISNIVAAHGGMVMPPPPMPMPMPVPPPVMQGGVQRTVVVVNVRSSCCRRSSGCFARVRCGGGCGGGRRGCF